MGLSDREILLADRLMLHDDVSTEFIQNMRMRLDYGINKMGLNSIPIKPVYCSTVNKHTCVEMLNGHHGEYYLILDEHHLELLGCMNLLFYMFGQHDIKQPFLRMNMTLGMKTPDKRLKGTASILLSEKSLLEGNATKAAAFLKVYKQNKIVTEDFKGQRGELDLDWFLLKERRAEVAHGLIKNYYVFHELAHIKNNCDKKALTTYKIFIKTFLANMSYNHEFDHFINSLPEDDIACDAYALDLLFDFMYEQGGDYQFEFMVESFISAVTNLTIMDSVISHEDNVEDWYTVCWFRIIIALNLVALQKDIRDDSPNFSSAIENCIEYGHMKFKNYKEEVVSVIDELIGCYEDIPERYLVRSCEWKDEMTMVLEIIASIS